MSGFIYSAPWTRNLWHMPCVTFPCMSPSLLYKHQSRRTSSPQGYSCAIRPTRQWLTLSSSEATPVFIKADSEQHSTARRDTAFCQQLELASARTVQVPLHLTQTGNAVSRPGLTCIRNRELLRTMDSAKHEQPQHSHTGMSKGIKPRRMRDRPHEHDGLQNPPPRPFTCQLWGGCPRSAWVVL